MAKKAVTGSSTVYTASAWWSESDPSMQVVALADKRVEKEIEKMMREAAKEARDDGSYDTISGALDDIRWSGVHAFKLSDLAGNQRELDEAIGELEDSGVWYPPTP